MRTIAGRTFGVALGMVVVALLAGATTGISTRQVRTAAPGVVNVSGVAAAEGSSLAVCRADHTHSLAGILPVANGGSGSSTAPWLPLSGGTLTGNLTVQRTGSAWLYMLSSGIGSGYIGFNGTDSNLRIVNSYADGLISNPNAMTLSPTGSLSVYGAVVAGSGATTVVALDYNVSGWSGIWAGSTAVSARTLTNYSVLFSGANTYLNIATGSDGGLRVNNVSILQWIGTGVNVTGAVTATGDITAFYSDARLKTNVRPISDPWAKLDRLRGVEWKWREVAGVTLPKGEDAGLIAQEVAAVFPEAAGPNGDYLGLKVSNHAITGLLVETVKDLRRRVEALEARCGP